MTEDAMSERAPREKQEDINRKQGQFLLDVMDARMQQGSAPDPVFEVLRLAHRAKAEEADKQ